MTEKLAGVVLTEDGWQVYTPELGLSESYGVDNNAKKSAQQFLAEYLEFMENPSAE